MREFVWPDEGTHNLFALLADLADSLTLRLFKNNHTVGFLTTLADLEEADYSGYAPADVTPAVSDVNGSRIAIPVDKSGYIGQSSLFPGNAGSPQDLYGCYLTAEVGSESFLLTASNVWDPTELPFSMGASALEIFWEVFGLYYLSDFARTSYPRGFHLVQADAPTIGDLGHVVVKKIDNITGEIDTGYNETVNVLHEFADDVFPATVTLTAGIGTIEATFNIAGRQRISAIDTAISNTQWGSCDFDVNP